LNVETKCTIAAAIRAYLNADDLSPETASVPRAEIDAAARAFDELACDRCAAEKVAFAILIFDQGKTMVYAAEKCYISYATAKRWKKQIVELVARWLPE